MMLKQIRYNKQLSTTAELDGTTWTFGDQYIYATSVARSQINVNDNMIVRIKKLINDRIEEITSTLPTVRDSEKRKLRTERKEYQRQINLFHEGDISCRTQEKNQQSLDTTESE